MVLRWLISVRRGALLMPGERDSKKRADGAWLVLRAFKCRVRRPRLQLLVEHVRRSGQIPNVRKPTCEENVAPQFLWISPANENPAVIRHRTGSGMLNNGPRRTVIKAFIINRVKGINPGREVQRGNPLFGQQFNITSRIWWRPIRRHAKVITDARRYENRN